ncbi:hemagglutinin repeat-containing protein, partial [Basilea psittacipulmonis]
MNKRYFRVIFSKTLQRFVAVSELAKSESKSKNTIPQMQHAVSFLPILGTLKPLTFRLLCALGFVTVSSYVSADTLIIKADPNAPKNQQPIIIQTANGLPQVNIQTPNDKGLSHNKYQDFNVDNKGAILNNSHKATQTQQAGWVQGNPYLAHSEAKVILNEVTSTHPSQLKGYLEVAGKKAEVIIANPNGLHCDGCGTINASRSTMTTGKPILEDGRVAGFQVEKGQVKVSGRGLDNSRVDYTDILAREAEINAGIWAGKKLNVVTGKNTVQPSDSDQTDRELKIIRIDGENLNEKTPYYALDVTELGGMYAEKIHLVGTDQGLGVRNAGHIGATAGEILIDSQGRLVNKNIIHAEQQVNVNAQQIENIGRIESNKKDIKLTSTTDINQQGQIIARHGNANLTAKTSINQKGTTVAQQNIQYQATQINNNDGLIWGGDVHLTANDVANQGGGIYASENLSAKVAQTLNNQHGEMLGGNAVSFFSPQLLINNQDGLIEAGHKIDIDAKGLVQEGTIKTQGDARIKLMDDFSLNQAFQIGNNLDFSTAGDFVNHAELVVGNQATVTANNLLNSKNAEISSTHTLITSKTLSNYGLIDGTTNVINTVTLNNVGSGRIYGDQLAIQTDQLNNVKEDDQSATIAARQSLNLGVNTLLNRDHSLVLSLGDLAIGGMLDSNHQATGYAKLIDNGSATIEALGNGSIHTERLFNHDLYLTLGENHTDERRVEYAPKNASQRYVLVDKDGTHGRFDLKNNNKRDRNSYLRLNDGRTIAANGWVTWGYNRHTITSTIEQRDPAKILIGGDLHLSGNELENNTSTLSVGHQLLLGDTSFANNPQNNNLQATDGVVLKNIDTLGSIDITDTGRWSSFAKHRHRYGFLGKKRWAVYGDGGGNFKETHPTQYFNFNLVLNEIGTPIHSTAINIANQTTHENVSLKNVSLATQDAIISGEVTTHNDEHDTKVKTHLADIRLPQESLYKINPDAPNGYLVETDARFINRKQWLSSDYMFTALRSNHENVQKRLGDGYYEQRLINEQINQLTGRRFLDNYSSDIEQYKALMDNGIHYAKQFNLSLGVGLTAEQMSELTSDMVWFVNQDVTLPNGKTITVLTPQVYLVSRHLDVSSQGALISAQNIIGSFNGELTNTGTIAGQNLTALSSNNLSNQGVVLGDSVDLRANQKLVNLGGRIEALSSATLIGQNGVEIASTTSSRRDNQFGNEFERTHVDQVANVNVQDKNGKLIIYSPEDVTIKGAILNSAGEILVQGQHIDVGTLNTLNKTHYNANADNYYRLHQQQEVGSQINATGDITLSSEQGTVVRQGTVHSEQGDIHLLSQGDIRIEEGRDKEQLSSAGKVKRSGFLQSTTYVTKHDHDYDLAKGSTLDGKNVILQSLANLTVQGSNIVAENQLDARAKNLTIKEAENRVFEQDFEKTTKSGLMGSGFGFTIGSKKVTTENDQSKYYATASQVGSLNGITTLLAQDDYRQQGSTVSSLESDVNIIAKNIAILAADDKYTSHYKHTMEQKGLTIAINVPVIQAVQSAFAVAKEAKLIGDSKNNRINAMTSANTAWSAYRAGQGLMQAKESLSQMANGNLAEGANVSVSITYGQQKNVQTTDIQGNTAANSAVNAGGKITMVATGADKASDIHIVGSDVSGKQGTLLQADDEINLLAAKQTHQERSKNKSSGFNAGVAISYGSNGFAFGVTAGGNYGKGYGNGDEVTWRNSHVGDKASQTLIQSGGDTSIRGAQVQGKSIVLNADNLNIASLQDTMRYESKQMNVSGQVTVGYGFSGSASFNQSKMKADYASVQEQSGLFAGDEGYQIDVHNHTDLKGALITSTAQAEESGKNRFETGTLSYSDIQNHSSYSAKGFGLSGGVTISGGTAPKEIDGKKLQPIGENAKDGSAKVEYSGVAGIANQGNWGVTKGIATALLGQVSDKGSQNGITTSSINTEHIKIRDAEKQLALTGKSVEESLQNLPKINLHQSVEKADIQTIRSNLERDLNTATEFVNNFNNQGDEIYYKMEKNEDSLFTIQPKTTNCNHMSCLDYDKDNSQELKRILYSEERLTKEQAALLSKVSTAGMLNLTRVQKVSTAILYDDDLASINDTAVILNRGSAGILSEFLFTGFERFRAWANMPAIFGASNATRDHAQIAKKLDEYNAYARLHGEPEYTLKNVAHSLGVSGNKNMLNWSA